MCFFIQKRKKSFYHHLNTKSVTDNKLFWKVIKPTFSDKAVSNVNTTLVENEEIVSDEKRICEIFNDFFSNTVSNLNIPETEHSSKIIDGIDDTVSIAIERYKNHPSITKIKNTIPRDQTFSFHHVTKEEIQREILNLDPTKASQANDIPIKIIKENVDIICDIIYNDFHTNLLDKGTFPDSLKTANITPVFKKDSRTDKTNYRPVSVLPNLSKIYERLIYNQISNYFENILSKFQCGFRKGFSAQDCLIVMIEKWKRILDNGGICGALLTDLSKAFDCLTHDLLIAKLETYGVNSRSLKILSSYLSNRKQRVQLGNVYSSWHDIITGVPQGSILGLLFNIFLSDLFLFLNEVDIANYADDNTPYVCEQDSRTVTENLESSSAKLSTWFISNRMKANPGKYHFLLTGNKEATLNIDQFQLESSKQQNLLGVIIDNKLTFEQHLNKLCSKVSQKLNALTRISNYIQPDQRRLIMKAFITSQFGYCPLVWMFHTRRINNRINRLHERSLRLTYNDQISTFQELLNKDKSVSIHQRNLQVFATLLYKIINNIAPEIVCEILYLDNPSRYNLRLNSEFQTFNPRTVRYGTESLTFLASKIWQLIPSDIKCAPTLESFKNKIKLWQTKDCPCRLCETYIQQIGFIS